MSEEIRPRVLETLMSHAPGTVGTARQLVGERLWRRIPKPRFAGKQIRSWGGLEDLGKNAQNARVYRTR